MLSVSITLHGQKGGAQSSQSPYVKETSRNDVSVSATLGQLYSFYAEFGDTIVVGESLIPMTATRLARLEQQVAKPFSCNSSGNDFLLGLIIVDTRRKEVTVSNAVMSMRPYFCHVSPNCIAFASTISGLRASGVPIAVDESKLPELYVYRFVTPPNTLVKGVHKLVGGQTTAYSLQSGTRIRDEYARLTADCDTVQQDASVYIERTKDALSSVLQTTLQSYKRPTVLLSGGTDSALLATMALRQDPRVRSCSTSFSFVDIEDMEESYAQTFADQIGIRHTIYRPSAEEYLAGVIESIAAAEEPLHHLQSVLLFLLSKNHAAREADLLINGQFSDGLFGDDRHRDCWRYRHAIALLRATRLTLPLQKIFHLLGVKKRRLLWLTNDFRQTPTNRRHILLEIGQYGDIALVKNLFGGSTEDILESRIALLSQYANHSLMDKLTVANGLMSSSYTGCVWGRLAEASGNVAAYPYAAKSIIDIVTQSPWSAKIVETKHFVKELLRRSGVPESLISRPKKSFGFPYKYWSLPNTLFQPLVDMAAESYDRTLLSRLQTGNPREAMILWNVINFHFWKQIVIDQKNPAELTAEAIARYRTLPRQR
jgi:asparagine synthetase B (glutamine-hydrolysing)